MNIPAKIILCIAIIITLGHVAKADTKPLREFRVDINGSHRNELISLVDNKDVMVKGTVSETYAIPNDAGHVLRATIDYVGDKEGYKVKYTLKKEEHLRVAYVNPSTFKSLAG